MFICKRHLIRAVVASPNPTFRSVELPHEKIETTDRVGWSVLEDDG